MYNIKRILVPVDFSACSRAALDLACSLAAQFNAKIALLHVVELPHFGKAQPNVVVEGVSKSLEQYAIEHARAELDEFIRHIPAAQRAELETHIDTGRVTERIVESAKRGAFDAIVLGTHGRTGRTRMLAGSIAESVVRMASCPVVTVREPT